MRLVGYVRVSRLNQRDPELATSAPEQRRRIQAQAAAQGYTLVGWHEDLDQPGSRYQRPGLQASLEAVEQGQADGIIVASLDRFARSVPDAAVALRRLDAVNGVLVCVKDAFDTSTPVGKFARTMMLALAELELDRIRENWATIRERTIERGVHIAAHTPLGYRKRDDGRLEPDPDAAALVRELFAMRARGASWPELCDYLEGRAKPTRAEHWTTSTVRSLISNRVYLGEAANASTVNPDAHEALVDYATWQRAQPGPRSDLYRQGKTLLGGIVRCESCGERMTSGSAGARKYSNYVCRARKGLGRCPAPVKISRARLDPFVEEAFLVRLAAEPLRAEYASPDDELVAAVDRVEAAEVELRVYRDANLVSVIGEVDYREGLVERAHRLEAARAGLARLNRQPVTVMDAALEVWPTLAVGDRNHVLRAALDAVYVSRVGTSGRWVDLADRVRFVWRDDPAA